MSIDITYLWVFLRLLLVENPPRNNPVILLGVLTRWQSFQYLRARCKFFIHILDLIKVLLQIAFIYSTVLSSLGLLIDPDGESSDCSFNISPANCLWAVLVELEIVGLTKRTKITRPMTNALWDLITLREFLNISLPSEIQGFGRYLNSWINDNSSPWLWLHSTKCRRSQ